MNSEKKSIKNENANNSKLNYYFHKIAKKLYEYNRTILNNINSFFLNIYEIIISNLKILIFCSLIISLTFGIVKTVFFNGYSVDSYQFFALSIEELIKTKKVNTLFIEYYARNRMVYPFIIAIVHIIVPINISILACIINLIFGLASIFILRKLIRNIYDNERVVDLTTLFTISSYNFINYWFTNITDLTSFFFMLITLYYFFLFKKTKNYFNLAFSFVFYIYSVLSREYLVLLIFIYIYIAEKRKIRMVIFTSFITTVILLFAFVPEKIPFIQQWIAPSYKSLYLNKQYWLLFVEFQKKWINEQFVLNFLKGLVKVGILIPTFFIPIFIIKRRKISIKKIWSKEPEILILWFIIYFLMFSMFYANSYSATGLRYWIPISWIPLFYISKAMIKSEKKKILKIFIIGLLATYPFMWSSIELYINRNNPSGTGPIFHQNKYFNEMSDLTPIEDYRAEILQISNVNKSYYNTTLIKNPKNDSSEFGTSFSFYVWINVTSRLTIILRLKSPTYLSTKWGLILYRAHDNFYAGYSSKIYAIEDQQTHKEFNIYVLEIYGHFLVRRVSLTIEGYVGSQILWDYIYMIGENPSTK
ncbi:MAG: hypothetical protein ACTSPQ_06785 [Candidatus Helarchaeota archaeon]